MGMVVTSGAKPSVNEVVCVKQEYLLKAKVGPSVWDDTKTGSDVDFGSWNIDAATGGVSAGTFFGITSHAAPADDDLLWCLNSTNITVVDLIAVSDNEEGTISVLKNYAPRVYHANGERYMPSSVEWAYPYMERFKNDSDGGRYWIKTKQSLSSPSDYTLEVFKGDLSSAPVYAFWVDKGTKVDLVYFFYYPYNRGKELVSTIWGNQRMGDSYMGYYRLEDGPTGPAAKGVWNPDVLE